VSDVLPKLICQNCLSQVNTWHMFKQVCDSSQATLKEWLNKLQDQAEPEKVWKFLVIHKFTFNSFIMVIDGLWVRFMFFSVVSKILCKLKH